MVARIVRGTLFALVALALVAGRPGPAGASHDQAALEDLVFDVADDVVDTWSAIFADAGLSLGTVRITTYTGNHATACGAVGEGDLASYCPSETEAYFDLAGLGEIEFGYGEAGVAIVVADTIGYHVLDAAGVDSSGLDRAAQASCLAGFWAWEAEQAGYLSHAAVLNALDLYEETYDDGDAFAEAFAIGYGADDAGDCFTIEVWQLATF
jgi:predicted metalloprotease